MPYVPPHFELVEIYKCWSLYYDDQATLPYVGYCFNPDSMTLSFGSVEELKAFIDNLPECICPPDNTLLIFGGVIAVLCVVGAGLYYWFTTKSKS